jgi:hypothetical protein
MVWSKIQGNHDLVSAGDYLDWKQRSHVFRDLNAWTGGQFNLAGKDAPEMVEGDLATPGMYRAWGLPLLYGRHFLPDEGQERKDRVVILMNKLWHLGADPNIIGKQIQLNGKGYTVVGVFRGGQPDRFGGKQLIIPLSFKPERIDHDSHWVIFGVMAFAVSQRTHEIGVRMALGSSRGRVVRMILKEGLMQAMAGVGLGLIGAYFLGRGMQSTLCGVPALDFTALATDSLLLLGAGLVACYLPARRAASVDPMLSLRNE